MLFRVEHIPHRNRVLKGKCRACNRHSTFKIKLHKTMANMALHLPKGMKKPVPWEVAQQYMRKEYKPIGKKPLLLCSKNCIVMAQLKFL